ncbi:hypothetical protein [Pseudarthrobacter sp. PS3-L1]|uniref:hypothetical protein n=1 Tax=Pseudarthrobacter sp. PS3-L1 TaxID=3046207 RepID=UPI0024B928E8|nr:hypothetical protein [Pseudarthrobacter sp. PS3-L1]MDJ0321670.1 hypothetical protein [Pseudarthrobacter sp. PS3-L1]
MTAKVDIAYNGKDYLAHCERDDQMYYGGQREAEEWAEKHNRKKHAWDVMNADQAHNKADSMHALARILLAFFITTTAVAMAYAIQDDLQGIDRIVNFLTAALFGASWVQAAAVATERRTKARHIERKEIINQMRGDA